MARRPDGTLELEVLRVLWDAERPLLPGEINDRLGAGHAYTSVATVVTRLHAKGLLQREPSGRAYAYEATVDESELAVRRIGELLDSSSNRSQVLSRFVGGLSKRDARELKALLETTSGGDDAR